MKNHSLALGALLTALALLGAGCHKDDAGQAGTDKSMDTMPQQTAPQMEQAPAEMGKPATPPSSEMPPSSSEQPAKP